MRRLECCTVVFVALLVAVVSFAQSAPARPKIAVLEFAAASGITQSVADSLADLAANTLRNHNRYDVIGKNDIHSLLGYENIKQKLGCEETSCLAEIGGALGVDYLVVGNIAKLGDTYLINLRLIDAKKAFVLHGVSEKVSQGEAALIDVMPRVVDRLVVPLGGSAVVGASPLPPSPPTPPAAAAAGGNPFLGFATACGVGAIACLPIGPLMVGLQLALMAIPAIGVLPALASCLVCPAIEGLGGPALANLFAGRHGGLLWTTVAAYGSWGLLELVGALMATGLAFALVDVWERNQVLLVPIILSSQIPMLLQPLIVGGVYLLASDPVEAPAQP